MHKINHNKHKKIMRSWKPFLQIRFRLHKYNIKMHSNTNQAVAARAIKFLAAFITVPQVRASLAKANRIWIQTVGTLLRKAKGARIAVCFWSRRNYWAGSILFKPNRLAPIRNKKKKMTRVRHSRSKNSSL